MAGEAALGTAALKAVSALVQRKVLRVGRIDSISYATLYQLVGAVLLLPALFFYKPISSAPAGWLFAAISAALWSGQAIIGFENAKQLEAPRLAVLKRLKVVFIAALGVLALGEQLSPARLLALALVLGGALLISGEGGARLRPDRQTALVVAASFLSAAALVTDKSALKYFPLLGYAFLMYALPGIVLMAYSRKGALAHSLNLRGFRKWLLVNAVADVLGFTLLLFALKYGSAIVAGLLLELALPLTVVGGMVLLGERKDWKRVLLAAALSLAGGVIALS